jgi:hypothetical protein
VAAQQNAVGGDDDVHDAGERRADVELRGLARLVARLVEAHLQLVRHLFVVAAEDPADRIAIARHRPVRVADLEAIAAVRIGEGKLGRLVGADLEVALLHRLVAAHAAIIPAAVGVVPLVFEHLAHELVFELAGGLAIAVAVDGDREEVPGLAFGDRAVLAVELDAVIKAAVRDRHREAALDRAPAFLVERHADVGRERARRRERLVERDLQRGFALGVGLGRGDFLALRVDALLHQPEEIAGQRREGRRVDLDRGFAVDGEIGRGRAVKETADDADLDRLVRRQELGLGRERHLEPLGDEILDLEAGAADRRPLGVDMGDEAPASGRRRFRERNRDGVAGGTRRTQREALRLDAVRADQAQHQRRIAGRARIVVAQQ